MLQKRDDTIIAPAEKHNKVNRIAIQGVRGAFHEIAARHYFEQNTNLEIVEATTFDDLVEMTLQGEIVDGDLVACPVHDGTVCSLCCSLDKTCHDVCKTPGGMADLGMPGGTLEHPAH